MIYTTIHSWQPTLRNGVTLRKSKEGGQHIQTSFCETGTGRKDGITKLRTHAIKELIYHEDAEGNVHIDIYTIPHLEQRTWKNRKKQADVGQLSERNTGPRANDLLTGTCIICEQTPCICPEEK